MDSPFGLLAELTYRCPLACAVLLEPARTWPTTRDELTTDEWRRVLVEAARAGRAAAATCPAASRCCAATSSSSWRPPTTLGHLHQPHHQRARALPSRAPRSCGPPASTTCRSASRPTSPPCPTGSPGTPSFDRKIEACGLVKELGWPLTLNVVLHRQNIDRVADVLALAEEVGRRPGRAGQHPVLRLGAGATATRCCRAGRSSRRPRSVVRRRPRAAAGPDGRHLRHPRLLQPLPEALHGRLGRTGSSTVTPNGDVLPCPAAQIAAAAARQRARATRWRGSGPSRRCSTAFRGTDWMPDPCRSCDRRELDFGGCRCQAFQLTGDAARTDPVCHLSPDHGLVEAAVRAANDGPRRAHPRPPTTPGQDSHDHRIDHRAGGAGVRAQPGQLPVLDRARHGAVRVRPGGADRPGVRVLGHRRAPGRRCARELLRRRDRPTSPSTSAPR